jgi:hypothetical protein
MAYYKFRDEYTDQPYGSCEVFYVSPKFAIECGAPYLDEDGLPMPGWYWWACFPGCMPDGEVMGPFDTEQEAMDDAGVM